MGAPADLLISVFFLFMSVWILLFIIIVVAQNSVNHDSEKVVK